jgi:predicted 3-demethylubiquinone-9 3-methyltransferase (glyoxalase superfamily)
MPKVTPNLWFDTEGEEAAAFYVSVFPNSEIRHVSHYGEAGPREAGMVVLDLAALHAAADGTDAG